DGIRGDLVTGVQTCALPILKLPILAVGAALLSTTAAKADTIIATVGPMTGQYAIFGDQMKRGAELAVAAINAKGGLLGQQLKLRSEERRVGKGGEGRGAEGG